MGDMEQEEGGGGVGYEGGNAFPQCMHSRRLYCRGAGGERRAVRLRVNLNAVV